MPFTYHFVLFLSYSTCFHKGPGATDGNCQSMVFKSTSGFSTYTNTPYLVGSWAIYTHRVSIIHAIIVHSDTRVEFSFFVIASGRSRSDFHSFQAKEEERKQLYVRSASSGLRFFYLSGRERKPFGLILDRKIEAFLVSDAIAFCDLPTKVLVVLKANDQH